MSKLTIKGRDVETRKLWTLFEWPDEFDAAVTSFGVATLSVRRPHNGDPFQVRLALGDDGSHEIPWRIKGAILHRLWKAVSAYLAAQPKQDEEAK